MAKDLNYWKKNAEEDYMKVPISVLRYISELEKVAFPQADVIKSADQYDKEKKEEESEDSCWSSWLGDGTQNIDK